MITKQKGTNDVIGIDAKKKKYVSDVIDAICEKYNYNYIIIIDAIFVNKTSH